MIIVFFCPLLWAAPFIPLTDLLAGKLQEGQYQEYCVVTEPDFFDWIQQPRPRAMLTELAAEFPGSRDR